jgi:hypothetical protein
VRPSVVDENLLALEVSACGHASKNRSLERTFSFSFIRGPSTAKRGEAMLVGI